VATAPHKYSVFAGTYDFRAVKLAAAYYTDKRDAAPLSSRFDQRVYWLGGSVPFGSSTIAAQYGSVKDKVSRTTGAADARQWALAYLYSMSKRTNLYAGYQDIRNDHLTAGVGGFTAYSTGLYDTSASSTAASEVRARSRAWAVGIRHQF
jgi:predicted porin